MSVKMSKPCHAQEPLLSNAVSFILQVAYILVRSGPSPRPGNWILERSINGQLWAPWQFFAVSDEECWHSFGLEPTKGKPKFEYDEEVICTSYYSQLEPMEDGKVSVKRK